MWAIDTTDVFVFCFHSLSVGSANRHLSLSRGRGYERDGAEKAKEKGHPEMSFMDYFILLLLCLRLRPVQLR